MSRACALSLGAAGGLAALSVAAAGHAVAVAATPPDAAVRVLPSVPEAWVGRTTVFNVVVSNVGGSDLAGLAVRVTLGGDATAVVAKVTQDVGSCSLTDPTHVDCAVGALGRARTTRIRLELTPTLPGSLSVSVTASAAGDTAPGNDAASATTVIHPGRQGPPTLRVGGKPGNATPDPRDPRVARVRGRFDVSEPGRVTVRVVDAASATVLPVLVGSTIGTEKLTVRRTIVTAPVGDARTTGTTYVLYDVRLPIARLRPKHGYRLVADVVDLEGQQGTTLRIPFTLVEPSPKRRG